MKFQTEKQSLSSLFFPIFLEQFLVTLVGVIDTAMVASVSDNAVGAVGASGVYLGLANNAMAVVSVGAVAMMSRFVGAGQKRTALKTMWLSFFMNFAVGGVFSLFFGLCSAPFLSLVGTAPELFGDAVVYTRVVGSSCVLVALNFVMTGYLRAFGHPRLSLHSAMVGNAVNLGLNALFISMGYGVLGVAMATLISRAVTLGLSVWFSLRIPIDKRETLAAVRSSTLARAVLAIGLPAAGECFMFTFWNSVNMTFLNGMGATAVNTYSYIMQIANLLACLVHGFSQSAGILVGWKIGAGDSEAAYREPNRAFKLGVLISLSANLLLIPSVSFLLSFLTKDEAILALSTPIMAIHLARLFGQLGNNIYGTALKTAGDAKAPLWIGVFIMPFWTFVGAYWLGTILGWGIYGYWIGASMDEFTRCFLMLFRWRSRKWEKKSAK